MKVFVIERHGNADYCSLDKIAEDFQISKQTARSRVNEIRHEIVKRRYPKLAIIDDENIVRVNRLVFIDYMTNRQMLKSETQRKYVDKYDPAEISKNLGYYETRKEAEE